jgi:hypothetical protein
MTPNFCLQEQRYLPKLLPKCADQWTVSCPLFRGGVWLKILINLVLKAFSIAQALIFTIYFVC